MLQTVFFLAASDVAVGIWDLFSVAYMLSNSGDYHPAHSTTFLGNKSTLTLCVTTWGTVRLTNPGLPFSTWSYAAELFVLLADYCCIPGKRNMKNVAFTACYTIVRFLLPSLSTLPKSPLD